MADQSLQLERRRINEEIEDSYRMTVQAATNIHVILVTGKGNYMSRFTDFYQWFTHLITLTCDLSQMGGESELCDRASNWIVGQGELSSATDMEVMTRSVAGITLFREYKKALMKCGVISLPTRRG